MKTQLSLAAVAIIAFVASVSIAAAQPGGEGTIAVRYPQPGTVPPAIDPTTGLPIAMTFEPWKDPDWKDPEKVLPSLNLEGLPLAEVVVNLREQFQNAFDVLLPSKWDDPRDPSISIDPQSVPIKMQLKNVTASEVFNAMNLVFEAENTPLRWKLAMNGNRPTVLLRVIPNLVPARSPQPPPEQPQRKIFFVGDLLGEEKSGGVTIAKLVNTISEVYQMSYGSPKGVIQFHQEAQLLIVTGTVDQISFIQETLAALGQKMQLNKSRPKVEMAPAKSQDIQSKPKSDDPKQSH